MFADFLSTLREFATSKKFIATVGGILITQAAKRGLNLPPESVNQITAVVIAYIVGQGVADHGKAAAQIDAVSAAAARNEPEAMAAVTKMSGPPKDAPRISDAR